MSCRSCHLSKYNLLFSLRSLCLTKNYCSIECRLADDAFHDLCCKDHAVVDRRKKKKGGSVLKAEEAEKALKRSIQRYDLSFPEGKSLDDPKVFSDLLAKSKKDKRGKK